MNIYFKMILTCLVILISTSLISKNANAIQYSDDNFRRYIDTYEYKCDLNIKLKDIRLKENSLSLGDSYKGIAIVTLEVENNHIRELELSNIDIYPYQNEILTKCFVTTAKDDIKGMVGYLKSGEKTDIKIGIALNDLENPLELEFISADENQQYRIIEHVKLNNYKIITNDF